MDIRLNEKVAEVVRELAISQGISPDEAVQRIVEWYFEDCMTEN